MKLNIGCGTDYIEGYINIDGSLTLPKVDKIINLTDEKLMDHFDPNTVDYILANDILEHHFHWEAVSILKDFWSVLKIGGEVEIRVPDVRYIIFNPFFNVKKKIVFLYGGQDIPQFLDKEMDKSRKDNPHFFCHKYGWTKKSIAKELENIGFTIKMIKRIKTNIIVYAIK